MHRILNLWQVSAQKVFATALIAIVISLAILTTAPSYAATYAEQKLVPPAERILTPEEKIERAYEFGEGAGILEESKQKSPNANTLTRPGEKMNVKNVTTSKSEQGLVEKAKELVEKVKGNE